jgi:hypothetical protein
MGPGLGSANKQGLPLMTVLAGVLREENRIRAITDTKQQLTEWRNLLSKMSGSATAGATWGTITANQTGAISSSADAESWLATISPAVSGHSMLTNHTILTILDLRNQVGAKHLRRVEVRACNLGQDPDGMRALREFLGAAKVVAPIVKTFYGRVTPTVFTSDALYRTWLTRNTPWLLRGGNDPGNTRTYLGDSLYLRMTDLDATPLAVLKLFQPNFRTCAAVGAAALPYRAVKFLVDSNFDVKGNLAYHAGPFYVGGLDPMAGRTASNPPPAAAHGKAFVVASEPEYRSLIVSNP